MQGLTCMLTLMWDLLGFVSLLDETTNVHLALVQAEFVFKVGSLNKIWFKLRCSKKCGGSVISKSSGSGSFCQVAQRW